MFHDSLHHGQASTSGAMTPGNCIIVHQGWSAWEWVAPFLGFKILSTINLALECFNATLYDRNTPILFSGAWEVIQPIWNAFRDQYTILLALDHGSKPTFMKGMYWRYLKHKDFDGITTGGWWCGSSCKPLTQPFITPSVRRLRHILSPMHQGQPVTISVGMHDTFDTAKWTRHGYHPGDLLPMVKRTVKVLSPSVFHNAVSRVLSHDELLQCFDIPKEWERNVVD